MFTRIFPFIKRCIISTNVLHGSGNERYAPLGFRINQKVKKLFPLKLIVPIDVNPISKRRMGFCEKSKEQFHQQYLPVEYAINNYWISKTLIHQQLPLR